MRNSSPLRTGTKWIGLVHPCIIPPYHVFSVRTTSSCTLRNFGFNALYSEAEAEAGMLTEARELLWPILP